MIKPLPASLALAFVYAMGQPLAARANTASDTASDIAALRAEMNTLRSTYEARLQALEQRLQAAEKATAAPPGPAGPALPAAAMAPAAAAANSSFNPALSLIVSGLYARTSQDPSRYRISGAALPVGAEAGPGTRGFSLAETELGLSASVDPWWRGVAIIALQPDDRVSVEEAYVQTTALGAGLTLKAGRFFSGLGYLNAQHAHRWDFVDNPLAYQALLGTQYGDDGVQLTWLAATDQFIQLGMELGRGRGFPGSDSSRNGAGMVALTAHTGGDLGTSHSWRAGLSVLNAKASDQELADVDALGNGITNVFSGRTRLWVADAVWKWAPNGNAARTHFKLQGEWLRSTRSGNLVQDAGGLNQAAPHHASLSGWYVQGVYQFMPAWRLGLRTERLDPGNAYRPAKHSLMLDFGASEFSRLRLQLAQDRSRAGAADRQVFLQYQMSLGAHGAHGY